MGKAIFNHTTYIPVSSMETQETLLAYKIKLSRRRGQTAFMTALLKQAGLMGIRINDVEEKTSVNVG